MPATHTAAQQAWLSFVDKVRRGEQLDPTGQYVKDGTMLPAGEARHKSLKLDAARDKFPFQLAPDGTVVLLPKSQVAQSPGNTSNLTDPNDNPPQECPPGGCVGVPVITSTFVTSVGQGGSGVIVDLKVAPNKPSFNGYTVLNSDLNKGAGGREIYFQFTRDGASVLKGLEYNSTNYNFTPSDPIMSFYTGTGSTFSQPRAPVYYAAIWNANNNPNVYWVTQDLNAGAGGAYVYSFQSKDSRSVNAVVYQEVGILSGNSESIVPPSGWVKWPYDLNEDAGGDFIYFCYRP